MTSYKAFIKSKVLVFFLSVFLFACKENSKTESVKNRVDSADGSVSKSNIERVDNDVLTNDRNSIIGKWVADENSSSEDTLIFESGGKYYEKNGNMYVDTLHFGLSKKSCDLASNPDDEESAIFLSLTNIGTGDIEYCYDVTNLDSVRLTLTYLQNGNILSYKKVK